MLEMKAQFFGNVQGVGFRAEAKFLADQFTIKGTVRNCMDGSVEVIGQGSKENLNAFIKEMKARFGARYLKNVHVEFYPPKTSFESFRIIH